MVEHIYDELVKATNLSSLQVALLLHISHMIRFGESVSKHKIILFTYISDNDLSEMICISASDDSLVTSRIASSDMWKKLINSGKCFQQSTQSGFEYLFPIVDNGGKTIGGISFSHVAPSNEMEGQRGFIVADTMQRLMLTATDEQIKEYEPISYLDGLIIFDQNGTILYGNDTALHLADIVGVDRRVVGTSIFGSTLKISAIQRVLADRNYFVSEEIYHNMVLRQHMIPIPMGRNECRCFLILHDCTRESKQQQELLVKNSIIKEIHHRVKNNLQTVAGLLRMEARRSDLLEVKSALQEGISRIESMALVHDLVSHYDEDYISIRSIYDELCRLLRQSMLDRNQHVEFRYQGDDCIISSHQASYISLIFNELISNSIIHGLAGSDGVISLSVSSNDNSIIITFTDSGKGLPHDFDMAKSKRLGMQIINNLVIHELQGRMMIENGDIGVIVTIHIQKEQ